MLVTMARACLAAIGPMLTWSSALADVGMVSTLAGWARLLFSEAREAGRLLVLLGLPSVALAFLGSLYVSDAQDLVERRHREAARENRLRMGATRESAPLTTSQPPAR